jgi:hypothetical protein
VLVGLPGLVGALLEGFHQRGQILVFRMVQDQFVQLLPPTTTEGRYRCCAPMVTKSLIATVEVIVLSFLLSRLLRLQLLFLSPLLCDSLSHTYTASFLVVYK